MRNFYMIKEKQNKKFNRLLIGALAAISLLIACLCIHFTFTLYNATWQETQKYLEELSRKSAMLIRKQADSDYGVLHIAARTCGSMAGEGYSLLDQMDYLQSVQEYHGFYKLAIANKNGTAHFTDGKLADFSQSPFIQDALQGKEASCFDASSGPEPLLTMAVPIYDDTRHVTGVLLYQELSVNMQGKFGIDSFDKQGHSHIINTQGDIVVSSHNAELEYKNLFEMIKDTAKLSRGCSLSQMAEDITHTSSGTLYFTKGGEQYAIMYVPLGMNDWYLVSSVPVTVINAPILYAIRLGQIVDACIIVVFFLVLFLFRYMLQKSEKELELVAFQDPITGGGNSVAFEHRLTATIRSAPPNTYVMVSMDILDFKLINKTFGEREGDRVLLHVYHCILKQLEPNEYIARIEGDKFKLLLQNTSEEELRERLHAFSMDINRYNSALTVPYHITLCAGVRVIDNTHASIIYLRDEANLARKKSHKKIDNPLLSVAFYIPKDEEAMLREKEISNLMEPALTQHQFQIYLQPKIRLDTRTIGGAEALVRWEHPDYGRIHPDEFIPLFEQNGFIVQLDEYMFEQVCVLIHQWIRQGIPPIPISINMSRRDVEIPGILEKYKKIQEKYQIPPELLELELTENLISEDIKYYDIFFRKIQSMHFRCSLDDFGSGYSSMNMLKNISVNTLKLDREFFTETAQGENDRRGKAVVKSILLLAKELDLQVVAEGIETAEQVRFLEENGCDMIQGYYFSRPVPASHFRKLLEKEIWE